MVLECVLFTKSMNIRFLLNSLRFVWVSGLVCLSGISYAQQPTCNCQVVGRISDHDSKQVVVGAAVYIKELNKVATSDSTGRYVLRNLCQGRYTLICTLLGFKEKRIQLDINHSQESQDIHLEDDDVHLQDVVISAQKIESPTQARASLSGEQLNQTRGQTLGEALKSIAGVTSLQTGSTISKPIIHGMHSNRVLILNNGVRQEGQQWGAEHAPEIDPFVAQKITVLKGAAGVRYGSDAIGGVILVEPSALPDTAELSGEVNLVGFSNGRQGVIASTLQGGVGRWKGFGWRAQGTYKRGGDVRTATYNLLNTGVEEANFSLTAGYRKPRWGTELYLSEFSSNIGIFAGSHIGNTTDLQLAIQRGTPLPEYTPASPSYTLDRPYQDVSHNLLKINSFWRPSAGQKLTLTLSRQYNYRAEYDITRRNVGYSQRFQLITLLSELVWEHKPIAQNLRGMIGLTGHYQQNISTGDLRQPVVKTVFIPNYESSNGGVFVIERWAKERWEVEAGMRLDLRNYTVFQKDVALVADTKVNVLKQHYQNVSGTLGLLYELSDHLTLRAQAASAWRAPTINELYADGVHHGAAAYEQGDPTLQPEKAYNLSVTAEYSTTHVAAELHIYQNHVNNYIYLQPQDSLKLTVRGAFPSYKYRQVDAVFRGFDASLTWALLPSLGLTSKYAFLYVRDVRNNAYLVGIPANRLENSLKYAFKKRGTFVSVGHLLVAQQTRVEPNSDFAPPPPGYNLWNVQAGTTLALGKKSLQVGLSITNLLNISYREYLNRFRYFSDDMGRNVSLRVKWEF
ncbi:MAG: TonB-dependent receptor [Spirosomataceae bacterium]